MHSVSEAAREVGKPEKWVRYRLSILRLGKKVGWGIVLSDSDVKKLKQQAGVNNGNEGQQAA